MKLLKIEKLWLIIGIVAYACYNIPGLPAYGDVTGAIVWNFAFWAIIWIINYTFNAKINKIYKPRKTTEEFLRENAEMDRARAEEAEKLDTELMAAKAKKK